MHRLSCGRRAYGVDLRIFSASSLHPAGVEGAAQEELGDSSPPMRADYRLSRIGTFSFQSPRRAPCAARGRRTQSALATSHIYADRGRRKTLQSKSGVRDEAIRRTRSWLERHLISRTFRLACAARPFSCA